jgi:hypothetical protein
MNSLIWGYRVFEEIRILGSYVTVAVNIGGIKMYIKNIVDNT